MRSRRGTVLLTTLVAAAAALGIVPAAADAAPAKPYQTFRLGETTAIGNTCVGKASGWVAVEPGTGRAGANLFWNSWTPMIAGPCSNHVALTWHNLRTGQRGKVVRSLTHRDHFNSGQARFGIRTGAGPVTFHLTAAREIMRPAPTITVQMP